MLGAIRRATPWPWLTAGLIGATAIHAATILAVPRLSRTDAFTALAGTAELNRFVILARGGATPALAALAPDIVHGLCRFDLAAGNVQLRLPLSEPNWSIALSTRRAANFYFATAAELKRRSVKMLIVPRERLAAEASSENSAEGDEQIIVIAPELQGTLVLRAPVRSETFVPGTLAALETARCERFVEPPPDVIAQETPQPPAEAAPTRRRRR